MISVRKLLLNVMPLTRAMPPVRESWQPVVRTLFFGYTHFADASQPAKIIVAPSSKRNTKTKNKRTKWDMASLDAELALNPSSPPPPPKRSTVVNKDQQKEVQTPVDALSGDGGGAGVRRRRDPASGRGVGQASKRADTSLHWLRACSVSEVRSNGEYRVQARAMPDREMHVEFSSRFHLRDLACLKSQEWLNSETINSYLAIVQREVRKEKVHIFVSHFMSKLLAQSDAEMKQWVQGVCRMNKVDSIYELDRLCMPYNIKNRHWVAICCDFHAIQITVVDSLPDNDHLPALNRLKAFLESSACAGKKKWNWRFNIQAAAAYRQLNGFDCGLFTLAHVTLFALKQEIRLGVCTQEIVSHMRERVYHDLIANEIKFQVYLVSFLTMRFAGKLQAHVFRGSLHMAQTRIQLQLLLVHIVFKFLSSTT